MDKETQNMLLIGGGALVLLWMFSKKTSASALPLTAAALPASGAGTNTGASSVLCQAFGPCASSCMFQMPCANTGASGSYCCGSAYCCGCG
ncbi:MAG: hypothetical protein WBR29_03090 [Gammaproteobacteria bacterium]